MAVYVGVNSILGSGKGFFIGATPAKVAYLGALKIWERFNPFRIENVNITNEAVPDGALGCWVTLIGGGGGGAAGQKTSSTGGGSGAGGAKVVRIWIPRDLLGATYSISRGIGGAPSAYPSVTNGSAGTASTFVSGGVSLSAGGGSGGRYVIADAAPAGGVASASGISGATLINGSDGVKAGTTSQNGVSNPSGGGASGGRGAYTSGGSSPNGGTGGSSETVAGAAGGTPTSTAGQTPVAATAGNAGAGGGGGGKPSSGSAGDGGAGGLYGGGGGGGGSCANSGSNTPGDGGRGGDGYCLVEWTDQNPLYDQTTIFNTPGTWTWTAPPELSVGDKVDVVLCSGGRGGSRSGSGAAGIGGKAGVLAYATITIGTEISPGGTLSGVIGSGGASNDGNGGNTTCTTLGLTALGATARVGSGQPGGSVGYITLHGSSYAGGVGGVGNGAAGNAPGGGGSGGWWGGGNVDGGPGAPGRVWVRAYRI